MPQTGSNLNKNSTVPLAEAAKLLGIAYQTAWKWAKAGRFDGITQTVAGRFLVPRATIDAMLEDASRPLGRGTSRG